MNKNCFKNIFFLIVASFIPFTIFANSANLPDDGSGKGFTQVSKKAIPAVVFIKSQMGENRSIGDSPFDQFTDELFRHFFGTPPNQFGTPSPKIAAGSGFLVTADGYIMTNNHMVKDATTISVTTNTGEEYKAKLVGQDPSTDLALLKIDSKELPYLNFGSSDDLEIGEWVIAVGNPFELQSTLTVGVVSATGRQNLDINKLEDFIQTDAAINPGNSGGPLLNLKGEVVGINTAILSRSGGYMGIGFAVPSKIAKHTMDEIMANGSVKRGYLGVHLQPLDKEMAEAFNLEKSEGVLIAEVVKDSPAEKGGLKAGDIVIKYNGNSIKSFSQLRNAIALMTPNTKVKFTVIRDGKEKEFEITLGAAPEKGNFSRSEELGLEVSDAKSIAPELMRKWGLSTSMEGVIVSNVKESSLAEKAGLRAGMQLLQVNHHNVSSFEDFQKAMQANNNKKLVLLLVRYQNITRFVSIRLK